MALYSENRLSNDFLGESKPMKLNDLKIGREKYKLDITESTGIFIGKINFQIEVFEEEIASISDDEEKMALISEKSDKMAEKAPENGQNGSDLDDFELSEALEKAKLAQNDTEKAKIEEMIKKRKS